MKSKAKKKVQDLMNYEIANDIKDKVARSNVFKFKAKIKPIKAWMALHNDKIYINNFFSRKRDAAQYVKRYSDFIDYYKVIRVLITPILPKKGKK